MAAGYHLTVTNSGETIELSTKEKAGKAEVSGMKFKMNTLDDNTKNHADKVRAELVIKGHITPENREKTKQLAKWAIDEDKKTLYRDVVIEVYDGENCTGDIIRRYEMSTMFVIDYEEEFGGKLDSSDSGVYTLFLAQREGNEKKDVFSS